MVNWNSRLIGEKSWVSTCTFEKQKMREMLDHGKLLSDHFFLLLLLPVHCVGSEFILAFFFVVVRSKPKQIIIGKSAYVGISIGIRYVMF